MSGRNFVNGSRAGRHGRRRRLGLAAMMNPTFAHADDIGLVIGGSGVPIPGSDYVAAADELYIHPIYPAPHQLYQPTTPTRTAYSRPKGSSRTARAIHNCSSTTPQMPTAFRRRPARWAKA